MYAEIKHLISFREKLRRGPWGEWRYRPGQAPYIQYSEHVMIFLKALDKFVEEALGQNLRKYHHILNTFGIEEQQDIKALSFEELVGALVQIKQNEDLKTGYLFSFLQNGKLVSILEALAVQVEGKWQKEYMFCQVSFDEADSPLYTYLCNDDEIKVGDKIVVPAGSSNEPTVVTVKNIIYASAIEAPYPFEKCKTILGKARIIADTTRSEREIFDLVTHDIDSLETLVGTLSFKKDQKLIPIRCLDVCFSKTRGSQRGTVIFEVAQPGIFFTDPGAYLIMKNTSKVRGLEQIISNLGGTGKEWHSVQVGSTNDLDLELTPSYPYEGMKLDLDADHDVKTLLFDYFIKADGVELYFSEGEDHGE